MEKYSRVIASNLTPICCVFKEKIVKNTTSTEDRTASIQVQKVAIYVSDRKKINLNFYPII